MIVWQVDSKRDRCNASSPGIRQLSGFGGDWRSDSGALSRFYWRQGILIYYVLLLKPETVGYSTNISQIVDFRQKLQRRHVFGECSVILHVNIYILCLSFVT